MNCDINSARKLRTCYTQMECGKDLKALDVLAFVCVVPGCWLARAQCAMVDHEPESRGLPFEAWALALSRKAHRKGWCQKNSIVFVCLCVCVCMWVCVCQIVCAYLCVRSCVCGCIWVRVWVLQCMHAPSSVLCSGLLKQCLECRDVLLVCLRVADNYWDVEPRFFITKRLWK
jgi:hypothetical protein